MRGRWLAGREQRSRLLVETCRLTANLRRPDLQVAHHFHRPMRSQKIDASVSGSVSSLRRGLVVWLVIALAEVVHGTVRTLFLEPVVGDLPSRQIGVFTGSLMILVIAYAAVGWIGATGTRALLAVGLMWLVLMVAFEVGLGRAFGFSWARIAEDYLLWKGGFMPLGMLVLALSPLIAAHLRRRRQSAA